MNHCIVCGSPLYPTPLIVCHNMPAGAQNIPSKDELPEERGITLNLRQCSGCGLIQFDCDPVPYYRDAIRAGGISTTMANLRRAQYGHFIEKYHLKDKKIIEIGCGQGEFLKVLTEFPVSVFGIEHKADLVHIARENGLNVTQGFVGNENDFIPEGPFDAFLSFNFLEHQPNPNGMLRGIYNNLTQDGYGLITVPSFEYIHKCQGYYELMRDHIANYTEDTLNFALGKNGFKMLECEIVNHDTLAAIVQKKSPINVDELCKNFSILSLQLKNFVCERTKKGKKVAVWGASHQGFTAISTSGIGENLCYIIDSAPFKQGKYSPASHVPIVAPEYWSVQRADTILIIAPGYTDEIRNIIRNRFGMAVEVAALRSEKVEILGAESNE
jgi:SAM-dependent methyltransferase